MNFSHMLILGRARNRSPFFLSRLFQPWDMRRPSRQRTGAITMGKKWMIVVAGVLMAGMTAAQDTSALKTQQEKMSYALGVDLGNQLRRESVDVDPSVFGQGLKDALSGGKTLLTEEQVRAAISELQAE